MVKRVFLFSIFLVGLFFLNSRYRFFAPFTPKITIGSKQPVLYVYAYSSFISSWGVGPYIKKEFEKTCNCKIKWVRAGGSRMLLRRMELLKKDRVDVVIGLDQFSMLEAFSLFKWKKTRIKAKWVSAVQKSINRNPLIGSYFFPYDWSPMGFIYKKGLKIIPQSFSDLLHINFKNKISLQNPLVSSPGLQFLMTMQASVNNPKIFLNKLRKQVSHLSNSWSKSYSLFKSGYRDLVFSYLSSIAYHNIEEKDFTYKMAVFKTPHPYQLEMMAIPERCKRCNLAKNFLIFLLTPKIQKKIMYKNFMFPVIEGVDKNSIFSKLTKPKLLFYNTNTKTINSLLDMWKAEFINIKN